MHWLKQFRPSVFRISYLPRVRLELVENHRDLDLFNVAVDRKLCCCDLVKMKVAVVIASARQN